MTLLECDVVGGVLLLAGDVGREHREISGLSRIQREVDVLGHHVGEAASGVVALLADHCTVTQKRQEAEAILDGLVNRPVRVHTNGELAHEPVTVAGGDVVGLDDSDMLVGGEVVQ